MTKTWFLDSTEEQVGTYIGSAAALNDKDLVFGQYREAGRYTHKLSSMTTLLYLTEKKVGKHFDSAAAHNLMTKDLVFGEYREAVRYTHKLSSMTTIWYLKRAEKLVATHNRFSGSP